jgi:predicted dehydrogenase
MRLALLGIDETTSALAHTVQQSGRDQIVLVCDVDESDRLPVSLARFTVQPQSWELLLTGTADGSPPCNAVVVSTADHERRLEQLRKLAGAALPILVAHPVHSSMLAYYELDMIRRETGCIMVPFLPARFHPLFERLKAFVDQAEESPLGDIDQIAFDRSLSQTSKENVVAYFARDVDLLRFLGGEITQLGAMGSPGRTASGQFAAYNNLAVQMAGAENRLLRWWVASADEPFDGRLTVSGTRGKAVLTIPPQSVPPGSQSAWRLEIRTRGEQEVTEFADWDPHLAALDELRAALVNPQAPSRWPDAARAIELAETIERSLAKGRTIVLYEQEYSAAATFKGLMTSLGCALLLIALGAFLVAALAESLLRHAGANRAAEIAGRVPYVLLFFFVIFLALQFLIRLTTARPTVGHAPIAPESDPAEKRNGSTG